MKLSHQLLGALTGLLLCGCATTTPRTDVTFTNPVAAGDYPDPSVIRVGNTYWATATSSEWSPQFPLLKSRDLVNWEVVGSIFQKRPDWAVANFWAPELVEYNGRYFVYYVGRKAGGPLAVAVASADKPEGPYTDHGPLVAQPPGSIDGHIHTDEKGDLYMVWKEDGNSRRIPTIIWMQQLDKSGTKLLGEPKELFRNDAPWEGAVVEGPFVVRHGEYFYIFYAGNACCGAGCNYAQGVARSKSLHGPWEKNPMNPIMAGNNDWKCPGHGTVVKDERGRYWFMYHAYAADSFIFTGREALIDEVIFGEDGWPTINGGKGPSKQAASPYGAQQRFAELRYEDQFTGSKLRPGWNWPVTDASPALVRGGALTLTAAPEQKTNLLGAVLGRSIRSGDFTATTLVDASGLSNGTIASLAAVGDRANATGIGVTAGRAFLWHRAGNNQRILAERPLSAGKQVHLRVQARNGRDYRFAFSADGVHWTDLNQEADGKHLPPWDRAVRVALAVGGRENATANFDYIRVVPEGERAQALPQK
ncbi:MAG TPA: family 43 glycosylhydrolase [Methylomirabilota bacterium]|nr:family 43 glycosylhydrolase [Methylomirabilota bacterium]